MAVQFKILKGLSTKLPSIQNKEGNVYYTYDNSLFHIDFKDASGNLIRKTLNADQANKLATARTITLAGDVTGSADFDGSGNITITATVVDGSHGHDISNVSGLQDALNGKQATITGAATSIVSSNLTASRVLVSNSSGKVAASSSITTTELGYLDGLTEKLSTSLGNKAPTSHASADTTYGVASDSNYGHAKASGTTPKANGTASVGSETATFARGDHIHPLQTTVSGNAGTATKLATARTISLKGDVTGSGSFDGSANLEITATVENNSHTHTIANISSLQDALNAKAPLDVVTTSTNGLMSASDKSKLDAIEAKANNYVLPTASSSVLGGVKIGTNINVSSGAISVPTASGSVAGVTIVYPAASCTTFSSDSGTITPLAAQKAAKMFSITRPTKCSENDPYPIKSSTVETNGIVRWADTNCNVKDSPKIKIEDVTNTRDTSKTANVLIVEAENNKKMVYGYCTDQVDGTSFIGGVFEADVTEYPYSAGLAIGGTSGNLLWKGKKVAITDDIPTKLSQLTNDAGFKSTDATTSASGLMSATDKTKLNATNMAYGTCSTAAGTAAKVVTISGNTNWALVAGSFVTVVFSATNTAENPTLNVNGTGAKNIYYNGSQITTSSLGMAGTANTPMTFMYDGSKYIFTGWGKDNNTTYTNVKLGHGYATCDTAASTVAKVATLSSYTLITGGIVAVKFTNAVPASATLNINSKGAKAIYYKGKAIVDGVIGAGEVATFIYNGSQYHLLTVDRNRFFTSLVPFGTSIEASESTKVNLNTATYMKVGNYFCSSNAKATHISNIPKANTAFMMQVYSPLSQSVDDENGTWRYRLRKIMYYTGEEYIQYCNTDGTAGNWTYGAWNKIATSSDIKVTADQNLHFSVTADGILQVTY